MPQQLINPKCLTVIFYIGRTYLSAIYTVRENTGEINQCPDNQRAAMH